MQEEARKLVEKKYSKSVFFDTTKRTTISIEMLDGFNLDEFKKVQPELGKDLSALITKYQLEENLEIDPTTIATDIQNKHVGKDFAARHVLDWLTQKGIKPAQFITVGDSLSDLEMAQEVHDQGLPVEFVFVGEKQKLEGIKRDFPVITTKSTYGSGTQEYLLSQS